ncbi:dihydrodipicolinate synthase family protein [Corynebacterium uterequi]|uniref:Dihydrodipicolinate synthase/N-acetylneuraminate lyase n=1 Tax=Corynebacterium uterequi TaxID=1072256 RepID=A0A0G3HFM9_9CORY|nr:dihydrodipicolinate synthase family protein [Corynebacterium uterequi]AKK10748.1 dihydrodipicolinate synthase/N-acetylneuraminate lyase [Corynebacterium uterequi]
MTELKLRGVVPPVAVPLNDDRSIDHEGFARHIDRLINAGVHGLFILGSSGEVAFSTVARREEIIKTTMETVAGRVPVLCGVVDTQTDRVIEHIRVAERYGVDGLVATAPFYALGGVPQIERHFRALREATDLPIYAYDIPVCVGVKLPVDMLVRLGRDGVLQGVKDSSGDDVSFRFLVLENKAAGSPLSLLTGHEVVVDGAYLAGADGSVPGLANVDADGYVAQWDAFEAGDWKKVAEIQDRLARLMHIALVPQGISGFGAGIGSFKTACQLLGYFKTNQMPEPVERLSGDNVERVAGVLREVGLLDA